MPSKSPKSGPLKNRNIKLVLQYDGTGFHGFQRQPSRPTVQAALEEALQKLTGSAVKIGAASGRTDAGVHASSQVVHFKTQSLLTPWEIRKALNAILPPSVAVREALDVPDEFHSRFHTKEKTYEYLIWNHEARSPFYAQRAWHVRDRLNLSKMRKAAKILTGKHDFRSFCTTDPDRRGNNAVRTIKKFEVKREGDVVRIRVTADGFLYRMVRNLTGALVEIGRGRLDFNELPGILKARDRRSVGQGAPAQGLYLVDVTY